MAAQAGSQARRRLYRRSDQAYPGESSAIQSTFVVQNPKYDRDSLPDEVSAENAGNGGAMKFPMTLAGFVANIPIW